VEVRSYGLVVVSVILLHGCGGVAPSSSQPALAPQVRHASEGNIYWSKAQLRLPYPHGEKRAVLTYWAPNGYFTYRYSCGNGSKLAISTGRTWGNSSGYKHIVYRFQAETKGPDTCGFTAVLNNTGSPPTASITLKVDR
jgi:hypothetical protein